MGDKYVKPDSVEALRREYSREKLVQARMHADPMEQFKIWFDQATAAELIEPNAMTLATADLSGQPSARIVLLKGFDRAGFQFYTNYGSRKGKELEENPRAAICLFWERLERQVRAEGTVEKLSREQSETYFHLRPRLSQIGAWASEQSSVVESRDLLEERFREYQERFSEGEIPLPDHWGGYLLVPSAIEFWQGREGRMHDRIRYRREGETWEISRLSP